MNNQIKKNNKCKRLLQEKCEDCGAIINWTYAEPDFDDDIDDIGQLIGQCHCYGGDGNHPRWIINDYGNDSSMKLNTMVQLKIHDCYGNFEDRIIKTGKLYEIGRLAARLQKLSIGFEFGGIPIDFEELEEITNPDDYDKAFILTVQEKLSSSQYSDFVHWRELMRTVGIELIVNTALQFSVLFGDRVIWEGEPNPNKCRY